MSLTSRGVSSTNSTVVHLTRVTDPLTDAPKGFFLSFFFFYQKEREEGCFEVFVASSGPQLSSIFVDSYARRCRNRLPSRRSSRWTLPLKSPSEDPLCRGLSALYCDVKPCRLQQHSMTLVAYGYWANGPFNGTPAITIRSEREFTLEGPRPVKFALRNRPSLRVPNAAGSSAATYLQRHRGDRSPPRTRGKGAH